MTKPRRIIAYLWKRPFVFDVVPGLRLQIFGLSRLEGAEGEEGDKLSS